MRTGLGGHVALTHRRVNSFLRGRAGAVAPEEKCTRLRCRPGHRCQLTPRAGFARGVNNSGGRCVAGAASESLKLACITISGMRRSPAQVRVLATYGAGHTIVEAEHPTAGSQHRRWALGACASTAYTTRVRRAIFSGTLSIETAHFSDLCARVPKQDAGRCGD
jgi:hypothetical protein